MKITAISNTFSFFGNFSKIITKQEQIKSAFEGFEVAVAQEQMPNGMPAPAYRIKNQNVGLTIRPFRIDIEKGVLDTEDAYQSFMDHVKSTIEKLDTLGVLMSNRIAYSCVEFIENENNETVKKLNGLFSVGNVFEEADEFSLRLNSVKQIGFEKINSIVQLQDGVVTNNNTKEQKKVVFVNKDINTVVQNQVVRFSLNKAFALLEDLIAEANNKTEQLISKL